MTELVEAMGDVLAAAGNLTLRFKVTVEFAEGETPAPGGPSKARGRFEQGNRRFRLNLWLFVNFHGWIYRGKSARSKFHNIRYPKTNQPSRRRCSAHGNGSSFGIRASERPAGCLPSKIADVTSGERNASRSAWRTTLG